MGSFRAGGKVLTDPANSGKTLSCDHGHVDYTIPHNPRAVGLFMWHSSSTAVWQNRWDGGEGYQSIFLRRGYPVYLWDGPRVGRGNWSCAPIAYTPSYRDQENFAAWRFGASYPNWFSGVQFPTTDAAAWEQATRARYDEFDTLPNALLEAEAAGIVVPRIGQQGVETQPPVAALLETLLVNPKRLFRGERSQFGGEEGERGDQVADGGADGAGGPGGAGAAGDAALVQEDVLAQLAASDGAGNQGTRRPLIGIERGALQWPVARLLGHLLAAARRQQAQGTQ